MRLVLLGPPGAGKGTQAKLLKEKLGLAHISTGDLLREEMKRDSALGRKVKEFVESGGLVPDDIVIGMIENKLTHNKEIAKGYMLDGFPRTQRQAEELDKILLKISQPIDFAVYMETSLPVVIQRLGGRRVCRKCGALYHIVNMPSKKRDICDACSGELYQRADDNEETIRNRMAVYLKNTEPVIRYYETKGKLLRVDGNLDAQKLREHLLKLFHEKK